MGHNSKSLNSNLNPKPNTCHDLSLMDFNRSTIYNVVSYLTTPLQYHNMASLEHVLLSSLQYTNTWKFYQMNKHAPNDAKSPISLIPILSGNVILSSIESINRSQRRRERHLTTSYQDVWSLSVCNVLTQHRVTYKRSRYIPFFCRCIFHLVGTKIEQNFNTNIS